MSPASHLRAALVSARDIVTARGAQSPAWTSHTRPGGESGHVSAELGTLLHGHVHFARFAHTAGDRSSLRARHRGGTLTLIHRGCYIDTDHWESLDPVEQHRARAHIADVEHSAGGAAGVDAESGAGTALVFSHLTAAALWRLPILGAWPSRPHVAGMQGSGGHRSAALARHTLGLPAVPGTIDGLLVTPLAVTVAQVAAAEGFDMGVVVADAALRRSANTTVPLSNADLRDAAALIPTRHGGARALATADFADGRADRPGESMSRVSMRAAGLPAPELQVPIRGASGKQYWVDFYWRGLRLIGEFDGMSKYTDPEFLRGRTPQRALADEKEREDDLRAASHGMSRWGWQLANSPVQLAQHLRRAGLR